MAFPTGYITGPDLNQYFVGKNGLPLSFGTIYFYQDSSRTTPKSVFTIVQGSGSPPNYTFSALSNPITLSAVGTVVDSSGNQIALYYYPFDAFGNQQLYYIAAYDQFGNPQFTRDAWPDPNLTGSGGSGSGTVNTGATNQLAYYATNGNVVSGLPSAANSVLATSGIGAPAWTQMLPSQVQVGVNSLNAGLNASSNTFWNGAGAWQPISAIPGIVVQVQSTTLTTNFTTNTVGYTDITGLSVTITPLASSHKILVIFNVSVIGPNNSNDFVGIQVVRNSTPIGIATSVGSRVATTVATAGQFNGQFAGIGTVGQNFLDSPATTSATTYKLQIYTLSGDTNYVNQSSTDNNNSSFPRAVSTITVMEVSA